MKHNEQTGTQKLLFMVIVLTASLALTVFTAYIAYDVARLFEIPFLKEFSGRNWFGLLVIISVCTIRYRLEKSHESALNGKFFQNKTLFVLDRLFALLVVWGLSYIMHMLIL